MCGGVDAARDDGGGQRRLRAGDGRGAVGLYDREADVGEARGLPEDRPELVPGRGFAGLPREAGKPEDAGMDRRHWFKVSLAGMLGGCGVAPGGPWASGDLDGLAVRLGRHGARGYGVWENGALRESWRTHERGPVLSITKALAGLACAKAMGEGWLRPEERVADTIHEWRGDAGREVVTVSMLLQMTAGLDGGAGSLYRREVADKGAVAVAVPQVSPPGTMFHYGPACWEVLAEVMQRKLSARGATLEGFLHRAVMRPFGLSSPEWRSDLKGRFYLSTGAELSVTDLGRLGRSLAALASGQDAGGIAAIDFRRATQPSRVNPMFGGGVWWNRNAGGGREVEVEEALDPPKGREFWGRACFSNRQPKTLLGLVGSAGQRVFVWPESGRVVARLGSADGWEDRVLWR